MRSNDFADSIAVAMFKFCYIDTRGTALDAFNSVKSTMESLESTYPNTVFVWWTMPIMTSGDQRRDDYNNLVRDYCSSNNKYLMDIADIECHSPDNVKQTDANGHELLYSGYSSDGGHLNAAGSEAMANAWWVLMSRILN